MKLHKAAECALYLCWRFLWRSLPPAAQHLELPALRCLWLLLLLIGSCFSGSQRTSWMRPWLLSLSLQRPHIHLSRQRLERLFNTLCLSLTAPSLHVPAGLIQTKPAQRGPIRLASQLWQRPAKCQSPLSRFYTSCNQTPQTRASKKGNMQGRCIMDTHLDQQAEKNLVTSGWKSNKWSMLKVIFNIIKQH